MTNTPHRRQASCQFGGHSHLTVNKNLNLLTFLTKRPIGASKKGLTSHRHGPEFRQAIVRNSQSVNNSVKMPTALANRAASTDLSDRFHSCFGINDFGEPYAKAFADHYNLALGDHRAIGQNIQRVTS